MLTISHPMRHSPVQREQRCPRRSAKSSTLNTCGTGAEGIGGAISTRNTVEREIDIPRPASTTAPARPASVIANRPTVAVSRSVRRA